MATRRAEGLPELDDFLKRVSFTDAGPLPIPRLREVKKDKPAAPGSREGNAVSTAATRHRD